jgi:parvulin-like peptidyl-prolyl isomerase
LLAVIVGGAALAAQDQRASVVVEKIIVKVNGEILTQTELEQRQIEAVRARPDVAQITDATLQEVINEVTPGLLVQAVDDLLLIQRAKELGYRLTDDRFQATLDSIKAENNLDDAGLQSALEEEGLTMADYRNMMERTLLKDAITREEILGGRNLTQAELRQYYQAHPDEFLKPATVTLREIFVAVPTDDAGGEPTVNVGRDRDARARIDAARARVAAGEDMPVVVEEVSEGGSKANGGLIGPVNLSDVNPTLEAAVAELETGQMTEPIRMANGYHVFRMEARTDPEQAPFETVRDDIQQRILMSRVDVETEKYLERLRTQAVIEWKDEPSRKLYEQGRSQG